MSSTRRDFLKKTTAGLAGVAVAGSAMGMSSKSYSRIIGANDRLNIALMGCGRRVPAYYNSLKNKDNNIDVGYICDVMKKQREKTGEVLKGKITGKAKLIEDIRESFEDKDIDAVFVATPDHWHTPAACMAMEAGKHVYLEKPCCHNPREGELVVAFQKKYGKVVQMGNQQRSSKESQEIIHDIHNGVIGNAYKAVAFYVNSRGEVPLPKKAPVPEGLNWDLFQGPAPHIDYMDDIWNYNWHWYGWRWGTAEMGNNATHELDVARWALGVTYPEHVDVQAAKRHYLKDGWVMYDTMDATFSFPENKIIKWDGKSRNGYPTYGSHGRGTIVYGTEGSVFVNRSGYKLYDRGGKLVRDSESEAKEGGTALGGGGGLTDTHVRNFFDVIRGKTTKQAAPISEGVISQMLTHYANISYRINKGFDINTNNGQIFDRDAMKLWSREYQPGYEIKL